MHSKKPSFLSVAALLFFQPSLAPRALAAPQQAIDIRARIDGRSRLILDDDTARWEHFDWAAPGRLGCDTGFPIAPTLIDGQEWWPQWPDQPTCENRDCGCGSDVYTGIQPALPNEEFSVFLELVECRSSAAIVELPTATNGYRVAIEFNDNPPGGDAWYEVRLVIGDCGSASNYCTSAPNSSGHAATIGISGSLSVAANAATLEAFGCPPHRTGLFFYGRVPTMRPLADGFLCISPFAPGLLRLRPGVQADSTGHAARSIDFEALSGPGRIVGGSTWCFQFWYRDPAAGGTGTNLTDAVQVTFCP